MPEPLNFPTPGELAVSRGFISQDRIDEVNESVQDRAVILADFIITSDGLVCLEQVPSRAHKEIVDMPAPVAELLGVVAGSIPFETSIVEVLVRQFHIESFKSLRMHADGARDKRILIEGHGAMWWFNQEKMLESYPHGLQLNPGDAAALNNDCSFADQVRHGVQMNENLTIRTAYLFNFSNRV